MYESPASILFDSRGIELAVSGGTLVPVSSSALLIAGMTPAGYATTFKTEADGTLHITGSFSATFTPPAYQNVIITNGTSSFGVTNSNPLIVEQAFCTGSNQYAVAADWTTPMLISSGNIQRKGTIVFNDTSKVLYLLYGSGTVNTTTIFSMKVGPYGYLEVPEKYVGPIYGLWAVSASGYGLVTEFFR